MTDFVIEYLNDADIVWGRNQDGTIWFKSNGFHSQYHMDMESFLIKHGFMYDFNYTLNEYDSKAGLTTSYFKQRKVS